MRNDMKNTSVLTLMFILTSLAPVCVPATAEAAVLQSFDQLFLGDDATETFEFNLSPDPAVPTTLRFTGFVENLHTNREGAVRFFLGWQTNSSVGSDGVTIASVIFPPWPDYLHPARLPAADPVSGPVRVPIEVQAEVGYSPSRVKFAIEGLTDDDNFRFVGDLTIHPEPRLPAMTGTKMWEFAPGSWVDSAGEVKLSLDSSRKNRFQPRLGTRTVRWPPEFVAVLVTACQEMLSDRFVVLRRA